MYWIDSSAIMNESSSIAGQPQPFCQTLDVYLPLDALGTASIQTSDIITLVDDLCGTVTVSLDITSATCSDLGVQIDVTAEAFNSGNALSGYCSSSVFVEDQIPPVILPNYRTPYPVVIDPQTDTAEFDPAVEFSSTTDNCPSNIVWLTPPITFTCADVSDDVILLEFNVTDGYNVVSRSQAIEVSTPPSACTGCVPDIQPPLLECKTGVVPVVLTDHYASLEIDDLVVSKSDNCEISLIMISPSEFSCSDLDSEVNVSVTIYDGSSLSAMCEVGRARVEGFANSFVIYSLNNRVRIRSLLDLLN